MYTSRENSNLATLLKYTLGKINISKTFYIIRLTFGCMDFKCVCSQKCFIKYICKIQSLNSVLNHLIFQNFPINLQNENYIKQYLIFIFLIIKRQNQRVVQVKTLGNLTLSLERRALNNSTDSQITAYKHVSKIKLILERLSLKQEVITMQNDDNHIRLWTPNESCFLNTPNSLVDWPDRPNKFSGIFSITIFSNFITVLDFALSSLFSSKS